MFIFWFCFRIEQTIGKQSPMMGEERSKATVLARIQRIEGTICEMGHSIEQIFHILKSIDEKFDRLTVDPTKPIHYIRTHSKSNASNLSVKFASIDEEIP